MSRPWISETANFRLQPLQETRLFAIFAIFHASHRQLSTFHLGCWGWPTLARTLAPWLRSPASSVGCATLWWGRTWSPAPGEIINTITRVGGVLFPS
jgi:hypothetical protein